VLDEAKHANYVRHVVRQPVDRSRQAARVEGSGRQEADRRLGLLAHLFAQDMRTRGRGKILLVASLLAYQGVEKFAVYGPPKRTSCALVKLFIANSNATASR